MSAELASPEASLLGFRWPSSSWDFHGLSSVSVLTASYTDTSQSDVGTL